MPDVAKLVRASMALRAESNELWDQFVMAMREYAAGTTADMVRCPPELLLKAQGMALQANELATVFNDAPKLHEKLSQR